ncbi:MAG TPA: cupin-like domain-containing protein [Ramlibacter sp.]|uniref:cupin-like domain-containing protein n=1 Tax=Ramlibacter sp. TaxID=1917967 RepID=UPI002CC99E65|nr:cupin-like domain-containing protein [Ramlibacter sp.]HVZ42961.1 cupin-like domain-containing protein [Ramlibacter sp.]
MYAPLPANWMQWMADNRLRECSTQSMLDTMVAAGLDRAACIQALSDLESNPVFLAARKHQQLTRKLESVLANQQKVWQSDPNYTVIERRKKVPVNEFWERYARGSRPVVLTGLAEGWPALREWTLPRLKDRFGHLPVEIQANRNADARFEENKALHRKTVRFGEFVEMVETGGATNDYYLTANNQLLRMPEFASLLDDIGPLPAYCDRARLKDLSYFWLGPAGTRTPLHHDTVMLLHTQVIGRKRWKLVSPLETPRLYNYNEMFSPVDADQPDLARFPDFAKVKVLETTLEPGETLFLPLGWWHQVAGLQASVSVSYSNLATDNIFEYRNPTITDW